MKNWSEKHIRGLLHSNHIRGYKVSQIKKANKIAGGSAPRSKALDWLAWNIPFWCNERALSMEREFQFCQDRKWRFDYAIPALKIAIEYEGGIFLQNSGHNTAKHYTKDTAKYNAATVDGWRVIRVTAMNYRTVLDQLNQLMKSNG